MDLKSTQYIEKTGSVAKAFLFLFLLFLSSIYNLFKFASLENEEVEVSGIYSLQISHLVLYTRHHRKS